MIPAQISIGPIKFHLYGAIIAIAILVGWYLAKKRAPLYKIPQKIFDDSVLLIPLVLSLIGARIYHVLDYWSAYSQNPVSIFYIWAGGLGIWGGIAGAVLGFWLAAKIKKLNVWSVLDLAAPSLLLGQAIGRIANFINQEGFGSPTDLPWGVYISPDRRPTEFLSSLRFHPTFFYEAIINFIFFVLLLYLTNPSFPRPPKAGPPLAEKPESRTGFSIPSVILRVNKSRMTVKTGQTFALYLIFYSISRFVSEFWRIDTATIGTVKIAHLISVIVFIIALWFLIRLKKSRRLDSD